MIALRKLFKKGIFLIALLSLILPIAVYAQGSQTDSITTIGFEASNAPSTIDQPGNPKNDVIQLSKSSIPSTRGTLPKTGEMLFPLIWMIVGYLCIFIAIWCSIRWQIYDEKEE